MSIDKSKETESQVSEITKTSVRRNFLKKSAIGLVATSMPAQSVWGACNASGISGGSTSTTTCEMPYLRNGRSPGSWRVFVETTEPTKLGRNKINAMFSAYNGASESVLNLNFCYLQSFIKNHPPIVLSNDSLMGHHTLNLYSALNSSGGIWNLAATYLNAYFGFYTMPAEFSSAEELTQHIWGVLFVTNNKSTPTNFDALTSTFTDGVTSHSIPQNGKCS
mmetsp:Transcript_10142/g.32838  ORF Transcript_10142/g.32838 Transcript_10142/m.32838 type:complete len:221 (-) Transcript_10142:271-933(-)